MAQSIRDDDGVSNPSRNLSLTDVVERAVCWAAWVPPRCPSWAAWPPVVATTTSLPPPCRPSR